MKIPGPDHPITITPAGRRWRARYQGHVIADSGDALVLQEASYPPVIYFPREDVSMAFLARTAHATHCPYKGDAAYYTLQMDGHFAENAIWTYEEPYPAMAEIAGRLAFYTNKVEVYAPDDAETVIPQPTEAGDVETTPSVDDVVLHTDSGSGASQREHWPANVSMPREDRGPR